VTGRARAQRREAQDGPAPRPPGGRPQARQTLVQRLDRLGLKRDWDFILHLPLRYRDETSVTPIAELEPGVESQIEGVIDAVEVAFRGRRQLIARIRDASGELLLRWLHFYPSQRSQLTVGRRIRAIGLVRGGLMGIEMIHPQLRPADASPAPRAGSATVPSPQPDPLSAAVSAPLSAPLSAPISAPVPALPPAPPSAPLPSHLTPVYPTTAGLPQSWLRRRIDRALAGVAIVDPVPAAVRDPLGLPELGAALHFLHHPAPDADPVALAERRHPAWARIRFDELLAQQLAMQEARSLRRGLAAPALAAGGGLTAALIASLPFSLTAAQRRVWGEIERDLAGAAPMNRLLQGDVGSGKTVIAALAAARAIEAGFQAALMAPTEILAEQHFARIEQWLAPLGVTVLWLTGRRRESERRPALERIAAGEAQLVIGTHALIQDEVRFARLGLAIVDEQHRFGVGQRLALRGHAAAPHLLMLSATPIPRTLAMTYLADVDVSVIDELPPGRTPVITKLVAGTRRDEVLARVRAETAIGRQAYWVCPLVEDSDEIEATAATRMYQETSASLPDLRLGLLHGQLPAAEKAAVMQAFAAGRIDVLVATTVVEVGIDVANATLMVIEHAQRFGLATLHQLRGRVGRGAQRSACVLLFDEPLSEPARARLKVMYETNDGFEIARRDLQLRGPGEFLGARQWGVPMLRFADLERDAELVEAARDAAAAMLRDRPQAARAHVARWFAGAAGYLGA
jgi:ATP-dependent DNA helicase RecG